MTNMLPSSIRRVATFGGVALAMGAGIAFSGGTATAATTATDAVAKPRPRVYVAKLSHHNATNPRKVVVKKTTTVGVRLVAKSPRTHRGPIQARLLTCKAKPASDWTAPLGTISAPAGKFTTFKRGKKAVVVKGTSKKPGCFGVQWKAVKQPVMIRFQLSH